MVNAKKLLTATALAGAFGLGLFATSSFASGPLVLGGVAPTTVPKLTTTVSPVSVQSKALSTYRQIRAFWLSRAIVR
jgi:hypothetical protein